MRQRKKTKVQRRQKKGTAQRKQKLFLDAGRQLGYAVSEEDKMNRCIAAGELAMAAACLQANQKFLEQAKKLARQANMLT